MKKLIAILLITLLLAGCGKTKIMESEPVDVSRFKLIESTNVWWVYADKETDVMYAVSRGTYNMGNFTLLVDADGKPLIYNEEIKK